MANLKLIHDNAADRATTLVADSTTGALVASYMQNDFKGQAHRSVGTSVKYTLTWTAGESIGGVGLPGTNLTASATMRVRLYSDVAGTALLADSTALYACAGLNLGLWDWTLPLNSNAFAYGGISKSAIWFAAHYFAKCCVIDLVDAGNTAGYIDNARLVVGPYWTPSRNADYGAQLAPTDTTKNTRNDAGDNPSDRGVQFDGMSLDLKYMNETDRARLLMITRNAGVAKNIFLSLLPGDSSPIAEQDGMIYGKRKNNPVSFDSFRVFSTKLELEGW